MATHIDVLPPSYNPDDWKWREQAACLNLPTEIFYYDDSERGKDKECRERTAIAICRKCPVQKICLSEAVENKDAFGIRGGTTPEQRGYSRQNSRNNSVPIEVVQRDFERGIQ